MGLDSYLKSTTGKLNFTNEQRSCSGAFMVLDDGQSRIQLSGGSIVLLVMISCFMEIMITA